MSRRLAKRKAPLREDKPVKERNKIAGQVLDEKTLLNLVHFINNKKIKSVDYPVSTGKEAVVFRATLPKQGYAAVKVYKYETTAFRNVQPYLQGDPRFDKIETRLRPLVRLWARKEFANLKTANEGGAWVPKPLARRENIVIMQFIGERGIACPLLKDVLLDKPEEWLELCLINLERVTKSGIVHCDLSEFNIIACGGHPWFIDFSQGVSVKHPRAVEYLQRDVRNLLDYFRRKGVKVSFEETWLRVSNNL
ncbi:MAG TPA: serine protein kinase RIO [Candidatus Norongarragalinales archaeon]|jgi:RIO kinase 1|nr:serine protein kinase RIO [Candidatus Norongarragalinales archaeon]